MAKVITFSQTFPDYHDRRKEKTFFVEKILSNLNIDYTRLGYLDKLLELNKKAIQENKLLVNDVKIFFYELNQNIYKSDRIKLYYKKTTIRKGKRFKPGESFSPRVWIGKPYHTTPLIFAPDIKIQKIFDVNISPQLNEIYINQKLYATYISELYTNLANNDGLTSLDFKYWFSKNEFEGQIICWDKNVNY